MSLVWFDSFCSVLVGEKKNMRDPPDIGMSPKSCGYMPSFPSRFVHFHHVSSCCPQFCRFWFRLAKINIDFGILRTDWRPHIPFRWIYNQITPKHLCHRTRTHTLQSKMKNQIPNQAFFRLKQRARLPKCGSLLRCWWKIKTNTSSQFATIIILSSVVGIFVVVYFHAASVVYVFLGIRWFWLGLTVQRSRMILRERETNGVRKWERAHKLRFTMCQRHSTLIARRWKLRKNKSMNL